MDIRQVWSEAKFKTKFTPPEILYGYNQSGEKFLVIDDHSSVYRIMNKRGQVYMVAHFRVTKDPSGQHYIFNEPIHIVSCDKYTQEEDQYAKDNIHPLIFK